MKKQYIIPNTRIASSLLTEMFAASPMKPKEWHEGGNGLFPGHPQGGDISGTGGDDDNDDEYDLGAKRRGFYSAY